MGSGHGLCCEGGAYGSVQMVQGGLPGVRDVWNHLPRSVFALVGRQPACQLGQIPVTSINSPIVRVGMYDGASSGCI